ncbi:MAG: c-type cytochrome [Myxococcaceae bacterium]|nr:c-type cytochrome [Myxococcaceae bacterium]
MRRALSSVLVLLSSAAWASEGFFQSEVVDAVAVKQAPKGTQDAAWSAAPAKPFSLAPQRTIRLHDKQANAVLQRAGATELVVRAVTTGTELALLLEWADATQDVVREDEVNSYADSAAVQVPVSFGKGQRLPAISMGDDEQPVRLWLQRATKAGSQLTALQAAGFGSSTRQGPATAPQGMMTFDANGKRWRAQFQVPLDAKSALVPVSFAVWEGGVRLERAGNKRLSSWRFVRVPGRTPDADYVASVSWGFGPKELGDAANGKTLVEAICTSCHHVPGRAVAPEGLAPSLVDIGAIATPAYLRESVVAPSAVILFGPNPNQHYDKSAQRDPNGAYPNAEAFQWFTVGPGGKRASKMPSFEKFPPEQLADIVAFLRTLDGRGTP